MLPNGPRQPLAERSKAGQLHALVGPPDFSNNELDQTRMNPEITGSRIRLGHGPHGLVYQVLQDLWINIFQFLDVQAALAGRVFAEVLQQGSLLFQSTGDIERDIRLARRKPNHHPIEFAAARIFEMPAAEPHNTRAPHLGV